MGKAEAQVWRELGAQGINPAKLGTFRSLVIATATTRRSGVKPSTVAALLRLVEKLQATVFAAPPPRKTEGGSTEVVDDVVDDPSDYDEDDGFPRYVALPPFSSEFWPMDAPGGPKIRPEVIQAARAEWRRLKASQS